jgi:hypothetical protein
MSILFVFHFCSFSSYFYFYFIACLELDFKENKLDVLLYKDHLLPLHSVFQNNLSTSLSLPFCTTSSPVHARHTQSQSQSLPLSAPLPTPQEAFLALRTLVDAGAVSTLFGHYHAELGLSYTVYRTSKIFYFCLCLCLILHLLQLFFCIFNIYQVSAMFGRVDRIGSVKVRTSCTLIRLNSSSFIVILYHYY